MNNNYRVSIIIPAYNAAKYIHFCIDSLFCQTFDNWEAIIINDGSTDNTETIIRNYCVKDNRIKLFTQKNQGIGAALNFGLEKCKNEYVARIDSDDIAEINWLKKSILEMDKRKAIDVLSCGYKKFGDRHDVVYHPQNSNVIKLMLCYSSPICHPGSIWRNKKIKGFRFSTTSAAEDHDFWCNVSEAGLKISNIDEILINYRVQKNSLTQKKKRLIRLAVIKRGLVFFLKNYKNINECSFNELYKNSREYSKLRWIPSFIFLLIAKFLSFFS